MAELASTRVFGKLTVMHEAIIKANAEIVGNVTAAKFIGDGSQLTALPWGQLTGVPSTFAPSSHTHPWGEVTGAPATATRWPAWSEVTGKPVQATRWPSWSEVSSKPSTFAPTSHTHPLSQITGAGNLASLSTNASTSNFLRGDGTWVTPPNTNTTYSAGTGITLTGTTFSLTDERFTSALSSKLGGIANGATANATNAQLRDRATHTGVQPIASVSGLQTELDTKVDKVVGKELSSNDFTDTLRDKLEELENFDDSAIQAELDTKVDAAYVNTQLDTKVDKTTSIVAGTGLSGGGNLSANRTLSVNYGTTSGTAAQGNDSRLSDSREWSASTVSQSEAEAGTATTRRAWSAQRVRQAIAAWWNTMVGTGDSQFRTNSQNDDRFLLKNTANDNSYIRVNRATGVTAYFNRTGGAGGIADFEYDGNTVASIRTDGRYTGNIDLADVNGAGSMASQNTGTGGSAFRTNSQNDSRFAQQSGTYSGLRAQATTAADVGAPPTSRTISAGTGLTGGGNLTANRTLSVDSSVVRTSRTISTGTGLSGGGNLSANRTISLGNHSANLLTSGTVSLARLPIGTGQGSIASYTTTSDHGNINFEIGTYVVAMRDSYPALPQRSDGRTVYKKSGVQEYTLDETNSVGSPLNGVWHSRGRIGDSDTANQAFLMQRIG